YTYCRSDRRGGSHARPLSRFEAPGTVAALHRPRRYSMSSSQTTDSKPEIYTFREEDIQRARDLVGVYHAVTQREQYTRATPDIMRNFARSYGDDNPLFVDEEYGLDTRWGGQIAPPMINIGLTKDLLADPVPKEQRRPSFRGIHVFVSGTTTDWYRPVFDGDTLYSFQGFENVELKES